MKDKLNALTESVSLSDAEKLADELASFDDDKLTDEEQQRILSSVMRKAGFEMNNTNSVITAKRNITSRSNGTNEEQSTGRIQLRRGGAVAACLAILLAGGVVFSLNRNMHNTVPNNDRDSSMYKACFNFGFTLLVKSFLFLNFFKPFGFFFFFFSLFCLLFRFSSCFKSE